MTDLANKVKNLVRDVPNFPKKGIVFKDITPVLRTRRRSRASSARSRPYGRKRGTEVVAGIESRGFLFGAAVAARLEVGLVPIRKKDKLPWKTVSQKYDLEYGKDIDRDAPGRGQEGPAGADRGRRARDGRHARRRVQAGGEGGRRRRGQHVPDRALVPQRPEEAEGARFLLRGSV
jgi:hypothetical protein